MNSFIQKLIQDKKPVYFVSPHLDDAIYSCGALIAHLAQHIPIHVINVFTSSGNGHNTLSARMFLRACAFDNSEQLFIERRKEDARILKSLGVSVTNLDLVDALWRQKANTDFISKMTQKVLPEFAHMYPTYQLHISRGKVSRWDSPTIKALTQKLQNLIPRDAVIFAPSAIGDHVDHVLVRRVCEKTFERVVYWTDFPYTIRTKKRAQDVVKGVEIFECVPDQKKKMDLMDGYKTQLVIMDEFRKTCTDLPTEQYVVSA